MTNQIAGFLSHLFSQNKLTKQPHFLHVDAISRKTKNCSKFFWLGMVKNGCGQSGSGLEN